jgi:hypothetical protein
VCDRARRRRCARLFRRRLDVRDPLRRTPMVRVPSLLGSGERMGEAAEKQ